MKYYVVLEHNNPKQAADYTVEDFKALITLTTNPVRDHKNITLTMIKNEADAIESAKAKSTEDSAFVVFAVTANGRKVKDDKINAYHVTFDSAVHIEPKKVEIAKQAEKRSGPPAQTKITDHFSKDISAEEAAKIEEAAAKKGTLKSGLKVALLIAVGGAALAFAGILPVAGLAAQFALGSAITAGTMVVAKVAVVGVKAAARAVSALTNAIKSRFSSNNNLPSRPDELNEKAKAEIADSLEKSLNAQNVTESLVEDALKNSQKGIFVASENGYIIAPNTSFRPKASEDKTESKEEEKKEEEKKAPTKK